MSKYTEILMGKGPLGWWFSLQLLVEASFPPRSFPFQPKGSPQRLRSPLSVGPVFLYCGTVGLVNEALGGKIMAANAAFTLVADCNPASKLQNAYYHMFHFPF